MRILIFLAFLFIAAPACAEDAASQTDFAATKLKAEQGDAIAQHNLGVMYADGEGVTKDYIEAVKWYRKAAEQGLAEAKYNLGLMYAKGNGVTKDYIEAEKWYRKAYENVSFKY